MVYSEPSREEIDEEENDKSFWFFGKQNQAEQIWVFVHVNLILYVLQFLAHSFMYCLCTGFLSAKKDDEDFQVRLRLT